MQYQITYHGSSGSAQKLAYALQSLLPTDTPVSDLKATPSPQANIQLLGLDLDRTESVEIPVEVSRYIRKLNGKTIFLFVTVPFQVNDLLDRRISRLVVSLLPKRCDYRGFYLCSAQPTDMLLNYFQNAISQNPNNTRAKYWGELCNRAIDHPNSSDIQALCKFAVHVLGIKP